MPEIRSRSRLEEMNASQRQAVLHGEGPLLLLAGPGSGKTFTITNRILYLLEQGIRPETILVITFTKEAALSMQSRFREMLGAGRPAFCPVNFGTFHSIFFHILKESHVLKSYDLLQPSEKKRIASLHSKSICQDAGIQPRPGEGRELCQSGGGFCTAFVRHQLL